MEARRHELETLLQLHRPRRPAAALRRPTRAPEYRAQARARALRAWAKLLVVLSCTILVALLSATDLAVNSDGGAIPITLFHRRRQFFYLLLILLVVTFYTTVIGAVFSPSFLQLAEAFYVLALVSLLLAFTILAWVCFFHTSSTSSRGASSF